MRTTRGTSGSALRRGAPNQAAARPRPATEEFLAQLAADFAALRNRPEDWAEELEERRLWESTLADGLDAEHPAEPRPAVDPAARATDRNWQRAAVGSATSEGGILGHDDD